MFKRATQKIDFPKLENEIIKYWRKKGIVERYLSKNKTSKKKFKFVDGPITANNPMGVHHAWGRTYKDLWQRFFNMKGFDQRFQNGFDEQGLWVEVEVEKDLNLKTKKDIENLVPGNVFESIAKFVNLCKERVEKFSDVQTEQSRRLGYFMDWVNSYHTSSDENNYAIWHYLKTVHDKRWLYKGRDSVPWCPRCGTAISQHEILTEEYQEITHKALFVKYPIVGRKNEFLLVWTTTPWTLPGNVMVAINPEEKYVTIYGHGEEKLWVMKSRVNIFDDVRKPPEPLDGKKGKELIGWKYVGPFDQLERVKKAKAEKEFHKIIAASDLVTAEEGTGLVHIAPGAGEEDFKLSQEQKFPVIELIDEEATYLDGLGEFSGQNAKKHPELIIDYLKDKDFLFAEENYKHRYPTCWRCKTELVWRVVDEWYINMDGKDNKTNKTYREMMKDVIKDINWIPKWGYDRELDWLNNMHDWLISKKRYWGLALPIWECHKCGNFEVIGSKEELKEKATVGWDKFDGNSPHRPWVDQIKIKCSKCSETISRIPDVGNPWLDAGIVPFSTLNYFEDKDYWKEWFPADFITESFPGQFKNWFYSLIAMSTALESKAPFKTLLGHGQVRDEKGEEMHKSAGNAIWFDDAAEKMGVDVMRWIYATTNPENNVNFGYHVADEVRRRFFLILWNVYVFFVTYANIDKWQTSKTETADLLDPLDRWVISQLNILIGTVTKKLERFDAVGAARDVERFVLDLSTWYVRGIRNRVSPSAEDKKQKETTYQILYTCLTVLSKLMAPFTPFITEEIYTNLTGEPSVHLTDYPLVDEKVIDKNLSKSMADVRSLVEVGHSLRKEQGVKLRQPLSSFTYGKNYKKLPGQLEDILAKELNVKSVVFDKAKSASFDYKITRELEAEGQARDLIRQIQEKRKEVGISFNSLVTVYAPTWPSEHTNLIKKETLARNLVRGKELSIKES